jgi:AAA domain
VIGRPSYNVDGWMCGRDHALATVARRAADADLALVEGVMGCFDGYGGTSEDGSTAQIAKWLGAPVVLVVDARGQPRSAAAVVLGFEHFDPELDIAAIIFNRAGGELLAQWLQTLGAFVLAFALYQLTLFVAAASLLGGTVAFAPRIIGQVLLVNSVALVGLYGLHRLLTRVTLLSRRDGADGSPARVAGRLGDA